MRPFTEAGRLRTLVRRSRHAFAALVRALDEAPPAVRNAVCSPSVSVGSEAPPAASEAAAQEAPAQEVAAQEAAAEEAAAQEAAAHARASRADATARAVPEPELRLTLLEQRLDVISERLELLNDRLRRQSEAATLSATPRPFVRAHTMRPSRNESSVELQRLSERVSALEKTPSAYKPEQEGTLRPPKVPRGLDVPASLPTHPAAAPAERSERSQRRISSGPALTGTLSGLSLGSLFSLLEFERSGGVLCLRNDTHSLELSLREGQVVRCDLDGQRTPATLAVREAFTWPSSSFSFHVEDTEDEAEPPQSVNALMLEALRFHDEELRLG